MNMPKTLTECKVSNGANYRKLYQREVRAHIKTQQMFKEMRLHIEETSDIVARLEAENAYLLSHNNFLLAKHKEIQM